MFRENIFLQNNNHYIDDNKHEHEKKYNIEKLLQEIRERQDNKKIGEEVIDYAKKIIELLKLDNQSISSDTEKNKGFPKKVKKKLYKKIKGCLSCGGGSMGNSSRHGNPIEIHHIIPREFGGKNETKNALIVCRECHVKIHQ